MDVFGSFQLCAIGLLAAPVTVRLSNTYFNDPGRNTIFVWSALILAGAWIALYLRDYTTFRLTQSRALEPNGRVLQDRYT